MFSKWHKHFTWCFRMVFVRSDFEKTLVKLDPQIEVHSYCIHLILIDVLRFRLVTYLIKSNNLRRYNRCRAETRHASKIVPTNKRNKKVNHHRKSTQKEKATWKNLPRKGNLSALEFRVFHLPFFSYFVLFFLVFFLSWPFSHDTNDPTVHK